ncbi:hypothetical protein EJ05DRAFT_422116, partial [Pseudovirgaria hyperparasitica]
YPYQHKAPMSYDWDGTVDYTGISEYYEPQGELVQDQEGVTQAEGFPGHDFDIPYLATTPELAQSSVSATPASQQQLSPLRASRPPQPLEQTSNPGMKRKADSTEPTSATTAAAAPIPDLGPPSKLSKTRSTPHTFHSETLAARPSHDETRASVRRRQAEDSALSSEDGDAESSQRKGSHSESTQSEKDKAQVKARRIVEGPNQFNSVLPAGKVFPIQVGSELFRLSGASISSDAPSCFSHFFSEQLRGGSSSVGELKTLYIDRDSAIFQDIVRHLQGYYVRPRDSEHFVKLFSDAQFYSLPRLTQQLFKSEIFVEIGGQDFRIPRDLFSAPGDSPNFFSLGFAHFFSTPSEAFPGLEQTSLLRPPSVIPPTVHNRSGKTFSELMRLLQGYPVHIENEDHRAELLRDARYFHLKGLEQRILPAGISYNLIRNVSEIVIRLEDLRQSGVSVTSDVTGEADISINTSPPSGVNATRLGPGWVSYARPYIDEKSHNLVLEISGQESTRLHFSAGPTSTSVFIRATFANEALARISSLFQVIANKMGLPATQALGLMMLESGGGVAAQPVSPANSGVSGEKVKIRIDGDAYVEVDGQAVSVDAGAAGNASSAEDDLEEMMDFDQDEEVTWIVRRAHWRLRIVPGEEVGRMEVIMVAVRVEAFTSERVRNLSRGFL